MSVEISVSEQLNEIAQLVRDAVEDAMVNGSADINAASALPLVVAFSVASSVLVERMGVAPTDAGNLILKNFLKAVGRAQAQLAGHPSDGGH